MSNDLFPLKYITGVNITGKYKTIVQRAQNGARLADAYGGGYWVVDIDLAKKNRIEHDEINGFLNRMRGRKETFLLQIPYYCNNKALYFGNILVNGGSQTGAFVSVNGMSANTTILKQGDFIKFNNHDKVYIVTEDLVSNAGGEGELYLAPNLISSPSDNSSVIINNVQFRVANASDDIVLNLDANKRAAWSISLEEAF